MKELVSGQAFLLAPEKKGFFLKKTNKQKRCLPCLLDVYNLALAATVGNPGFS